MLFIFTVFCLTSAVGYKPNSRLCSECDVGYSHGDTSVTGECKLCPPTDQNKIITATSILSSLIGLAVLIKITISDEGEVNLADGIKLILFSAIQMLSLVASFPIKWPDIFISVFEIGGQLSLLSQHLLNFQCLIEGSSDASVFYLTRTLWAILPLMIVLGCILTWSIIAVFGTMCGGKCCCKCSKDLFYYEIFNPYERIKLSCVTILYFIYPTLVQETFNLMSCRKGKANKMRTVVLFDLWLMVGIVESWSRGAPPY